MGINNTLYDDRINVSMKSNINKKKLPYTRHLPSLCTMKRENMSRLSPLTYRPIIQMKTMYKITWMLTIMLVVCTDFVATNSISNNKQMTEVFSVVSGLAHLPCDLTPPNATNSKDTPRLVLWYKNDDPQPIYSFDARFSTVKHWSEDRNFGPRSVFKTKNTNPAQLG